MKKEGKISKNKTITLGRKQFTNDYIQNNNINFAEPKTVQLKLLNTYRLTDEYRKAYGNYIIDNYPNGKGVTMAINAIKKFKHIENVNIKKHRNLIIDLMYSLSVLGFQHLEYFCYGFENISIKERLTFMSNLDIIHYYEVFNKNKEAAHILGNKWETYLKFKKYFKREIINVTNKSDKKEFLEFAKNFDKFIIKPTTGTMGKRIEIIDTKKYNSLENVYKYIISLNTDVICEELVKQDKAFRQLHEESVNTVRVSTYCNNNKVKIVCVYMKIGCGNSIVDNAGSGGMLTTVDNKTGTVITDACNENAVTFITHPDTGFKFKGFKIPRYNELIKLAKEVALQLPEVPLIGWDFALSENKGWQLIEGNEGGQIFAAQIPLKKGKKAEYEKAFEWKKWENKNTTIERNLYDNKK